MKKLFPILIGLGLTGFSAMSQAENLLHSLLGSRGIS